MYYTTYDEVHVFLGFIMMTFGLAFFVSVTIEASFLNLEKLILMPLAAAAAPRARQTDLALPSNEKQTDDVEKSQEDGTVNEAFQHEKL